ncbi:LexA family protein [Solimonas marina]|uniref:LexA repressor DNA-binding domain-containing protein n=1 Tax=Solimonas marina TaxID=2714601 RepID=A0A969WBG4_9GAMM|nr:hypothetical protein [Solimonas marina]NKF23459.1 hypothetical protein [Solimonas marina]
MSLTIRQLQILGFIEDRIRESGDPPSAEELARHFGYADAMARDQLQRLARKGRLELPTAAARGMRLLGEVDGPRQFELPMFGQPPH